MSPTKHSAEQQRRWDFLFRQLKERLSRPTNAHPAAKVWKQSELVSAISAVRKEHMDELKTTFPPAKEVVERMRAIGWLLPIPLEPLPPEDPPQPLYLLDMEATEEDMPHVLEVLQGYESDGVLCYAAVLAHHELTTQIPTFAHVGILQDYGASADAAAALKATAPVTESASEPRSTRDPLGTRLFAYQGTECYLTRRDRALSPGVQTRMEGPRTQLRVTTLEQTLLDALFYPVRCGGEAIVFEAWERGVERWNPSRLAEHLEAIGRNDFSRRVGAMLAVLDVPSIPSALSPLLEAASKQWQYGGDGEESIPLLRHLDYDRLLPEWGVRVP